MVVKMKCVRKTKDTNATIHKLFFCISIFLRQTLVFSLFLFSHVFEHFAMEFSFSSLYGENLFVR